MKTIFKKSLIVLMAALVLLTAAPVAVGTSAEEALLKLGDVDQNNKINTSDARLVLQFAAEIIGLDPLAQTLADVNADGYTNTTDARYILQYAAGIITLFPAETVSMQDLAESVEYVLDFLTQYRFVFTEDSVAALYEEINHANSLLERGTCTNDERVDAIFRLIAGLYALEVAE